MQISNGISGFAAYAVLFCLLTGTPRPVVTSAESPRNLQTPADGNSASHPSKKLIQWGTDEPSTQYYRQHVREFEQMPFDGVVLHLNPTPYGNFAWETWGERRYQIGEFRECIEDLLASRSSKLTDRFLRVNVTPGTADWFDDNAWDTIRHNFSVAARVAKQGDCRGLMFDTEQYQGELFYYPKLPPRPFEEYREQVRRRGKEWIQAINREFPEVTILIPFAYTYSQHPPRPTEPESNAVGEERSSLAEGTKLPADLPPRAQALYGLLADFLDGALEGCSEQTVFVDAFEPSYPYRTSEQFENGYQRITSAALDWTGLPDKYRKHFRAGFGVWMDNRLKDQPWDLTDFERNHFTPDQFRDAVRAALSRSDEYVWIYTDRPRWWTKENLPEEYIRALEQARE